MGFFNWASTKASNQGNKLKNFTRRVTSADELEKNGQFILGMVKDLSPGSKDEVVQETFENAYRRQGLTEESLAKTYSSFLMRFNIFLFFGVVGISLGIWYAVIGSWAFVAIIGFLFYCAGQMFVASFRMLQIRRREMLPVSYWVSMPREWWPQSFKPLRTSSSRQVRPGRSSSTRSDGVVNLNDRRNRPGKN